MKQQKFVEFNQNDICIIDKDKITELTEKAMKHPLKKYRYCLHHSPEDSLHEMIIVTTKDDLKYPDMHTNTSESNIILEGKLLVVLFTDEGDISDAFIMEPEGKFYYRCEKNKYHMTIPLTDVAVYIETKEGPFTEKSNIFPVWAPDKEDKREMTFFQQKIKEEALLKFLREKKDE